MPRLTRDLTAVLPCTGEPIHERLAHCPAEESGVPQRIAAHARENASFTAAAERRLLTWIALRLPPRVTSDALSPLGLAAMVGVGVSFAALRWTPSAAAAIVVLLGVNW